MTPILDSMAVLAANKGNDESGVLILADKEWLATSIFNKVRVRHNCGSYDDFVIRGGYGDYLAYDVKNHDEIQCYEDPDKAFYFSKASTVKFEDNCPTAFVYDPLNGCGVTQKTVWFNLYYLIDKATDELSKVINNVPPVDNKTRLDVFHNVIEKRAIPFILDELPRIMVEFLGHPLTEIIDLMKHEIQTIYQLIFLLSDHKAGVGNSCFMWHLNPKRRGRNYFHIPFFEGCDATGFNGVIFNFPLGDCLRTGDVESGCDWLGDDNIVYEESFDGAPDYYLFRNISELMEANKLMPLRFDCRWQYLSIGLHRLNGSTIMKEVLTHGLKTISATSFINCYFAESVAKKGVASVNWEGIFCPDFSSFCDYYD